MEDQRPEGWAWTVCHLCGARFDNDVSAAAHLVRHRIGSTVDDRSTNARQARRTQVAELREMLWNSVADFARQEITTTVVEFSLPNPTTAGEFGKAYAVARAELDEAGVDDADDTITIEGRDEEVGLRRLGRAAAVGSPIVSGASAYIDALCSLDTYRRS